MSKLDRMFTKQAGEAERFELEQKRDKEEIDLKVWCGTVRCRVTFGPACNLFGDNIERCGASIPNDSRATRRAVQVCRRF